MGNQVGNHFVGLLAALGLLGACTTVIELPVEEVNESAGQAGAPTAQAPIQGGDAPTGMVSVHIAGSVLLANGFTDQITGHFAAEMTAGSAMGRMRLTARFCADAACTVPIAVTNPVVEGADAMGFYVFSSASPSGTGFDKAFVITEAPAGTSYLQLIGDTEFSVGASKGACTSVVDCPGDADVLQVASWQTIAPNASGGVPESNPAASTTLVHVDAPGQALALDTVTYLGHVFYEGEKLWAPDVPVDGGRMLAATSNAQDDARNFMALISLEDVTGSSGQPGADSYTLQKNGSDFQGDVCGVIRGDSGLFAIAVDNEGAHVMRLNLDGTQAYDEPVATITPPNPQDATAWPWPCRGVWAESGGHEWLYLVQHKGAGSDDTSRPYPLYSVNLQNGTWEGHGAETHDKWAIRGLVHDAANGRLIGLDMSWSKANLTAQIGFHRLLPIPILADGSLDEPGQAVITDVFGDERCDSTVHWVSGMSLAMVGGQTRLLVGHDYGVAAYDPSTLVKFSDLDLTSYGRLIGQIALSPDGSRAYAVPHCKALSALSDFTLPYGAGVEISDKNLAAELDLSGANLSVAQTQIDINGDGLKDNGIDLDFYRVKQYIRSYSSTMSIPPVVFTAPQMAVGESVVFLRGTGIQGNGYDTMSSPGLGQARDLGVFDRATGHGAVLNDYLPWFNGLSAEDGTAVWGYPIWQDHASSVGWVEYLPAPQ
jgi:hypothetical protein